MKRLFSLAAAALVAIALTGTTAVAPASAQNIFTALFGPAETKAARPQPRKAVKRKALRRTTIVKSAALAAPAPAAALTPADIRKALRDAVASDPALLRDVVGDLLRNDADIRKLLVPATPAPAAQASSPPAAVPADPAQDQVRMEQVVRNYLLTHPEVLQEAMVELEKRQTAAEQAKQKAALAKNAETLFNSPRQVVVGNPQGDVTVVEFFDYNCGYCKRAMTDMLELIKGDPKLRFVLREFPVLGEGSVEAAQVATAVRMQDKTGKKYLDFHQNLLGGRGEANKARAMAAAKEAGIDMARLEKDMASDEVKASLKESFEIAEALGMNGTPSYVVGEDVVIGAVGVDQLKTKISNARCGKATC